MVRNVLTVLTVLCLVHTVHVKHNQTVFLCSQCSSHSPIRLCPFAHTVTAQPSQIVSLCSYGYCTAQSDCVPLLIQLLHSPVRLCPFADTVTAQPSQIVSLCWYSYCKAQSDCVPLFIWLLLPSLIVSFSLCHMTLSTLWSYVIKYHSTRHVGAMCHMGAESTSHSLEHILLSAGGKFAWPISTEVKEVNWHQG